MVTALGPVASYLQSVGSRRFKALALAEVVVQFLHEGIDTAVVSHRSKVISSGTVRIEQNVLISRPADVAHDDSASMDCPQRWIRHGVTHCVLHPADVDYIHGLSLRGTGGASASRRRMCPPRGVR